ncbi:MAG: Gfo/Idh/MocA family protein, partial [Acidimicrobiales bacterium]
MSTRIGLVGTGNIFPRYIAGLRRFPNLEILGCADVVQQRAEVAAAQHGLTAYPSVEALLHDAAVDVVVNITTPAAHAAVTEAALRAGRHVYSEKPLAATPADGRRLLAVAEETGRRLGCAPDTFLGSAAQTARAAIDSGRIGDVVGAAGFVTHSRAERWHPDPTFLFSPGGGPLLDMGPYT